MSETRLLEAIQQTETFKGFPKFKQNITLSYKNVKHINDLYLKAKNLGVDYLKDKQYIFGSDVKLIEDILNNEKYKND